MLEKTLMMILRRQCMVGGEVGDNEDGEEHEEEVHCSTLFFYIPFERTYPSLLSLHIHTHTYTHTYYR